MRGCGDGFVKFSRLILGPSVVWLDRILKQKVSRISYVENHVLCGQ